MSGGPASPRRSLRRRLRHAILVYLVIGLIHVLRWLPLRAASALGGALGGLVGRLPLKERQRARDNLAAAWPEVPELRQQAIVQAMFEHTGRTVLEWVVMQRRPGLGPPGEAPVRFSEGSLDCLRASLARGRGVIFATAHVGNWELMGAIVAREARVTVLFKPSPDARLTRLMVAFRERQGVSSVDVTRPGHLRRALSALRDGGVLGILVDQPVRGAPLRPFFGRPAPTSTLAAALALRHGVPLLFGTILRCGPCQHAITIEAPELPESLDELGVCDLLNRRLERVIREHPDAWLWSLDRYRASDEQPAKGS